MATHSSILAWRIPGTGEPGGLPSMGSTVSDTTEVTQQQQQHSYNDLACKKKKKKESIKLNVYSREKNCMQLKQTLR